MGVHVHGSDRIGHYHHLQALSQCVEDAVLDAVVGGEAGHVEAVDALRSQSLREPASLKGGVTLAVRILTLVENDVHLAPVEVGMKLGALRPGDAVDRPDARWIGAIPSGGIDLDADERAMVRRMPVPGRHDEIELIGEAVDRAGDLVSSLDGERAAGSEVVLEVGDEQGVDIAILAP